MTSEDGDKPRRAERRLEELEARLRLITEELDDVFAEIGPGGAFTYASPNIERLLGLAPKDLAGRRFHEFVHPDDVGQLEAEFPDGSDSVSGRRTFRLRGPDGRWHWVEARGRAYRLPNDEVRFAGIMREVTAAREAELRFHQLARHGRDLMSEVDEQGRFAWLSPNHGRWMGYAPESLLGRDVLEFVHPEDADSIRSFLTSASGRSMEITIRVRDADGRFRWFECVGNTFDGTNDEVRSLWVGRDVTERVETQRELVASKTRAENLARRLERAREREGAEIARDVHDDLGQGLTGLALGIGAMLAECDLDASTRERVERLGQEIECIDESLRRIVARLWPAALEFGLAAAIETHARDLGAACGWEIELDFDAEELVLDREREAAIFRIAQEALTNVARHADARHVQVCLHVGKDELRLEVRDDGRGLPKGAPQGGHHGLAGMRERALAWGGQFRIESAASKTLIQVELPLDPDRDGR